MSRFGPAGLAWQGWDWVPSGWLRGGSDGRSVFDSDDGALAGAAGVVVVLLLVVVLLVAALGALWLWAVVRVARTPEWAFEAAGTGKGRWLLVTMLLGPVGGFAWLVAGRLRVRAAEHEHHQTLDGLYASR